MTKIVNRAIFCNENTRVIHNYPQIVGYNHRKPAGNGCGKCLDNRWVTTNQTGDYISAVPNPDTAHITTCGHRGIASGQAKRYLDWLNVAISTMHRSYYYQYIFNQHLDWESEQRL